MNLRIRFFRHGFTTSNEEHKYLGREDEALSENGRQMLREKRDRIKAAGFLFVSPMRRCLESAEELFPEKKGIVIPEWTEIDFGAFEGKSFEELKEKESYQAWLASGGCLPFPDGESREAFIDRSMQGYERMLAQVREHLECPGTETVSVDAVVNGGTIMAVCSSLFGGDYFDYQISCGGEYLCPSILI